MINTQSCLQAPDLKRQNIFQSKITPTLGKISKEPNFKFAFNTRNR